MPVYSVIRHWNSAPATGTTSSCSTTSPRKHSSKKAAPTTTPPMTWRCTITPGYACTTASYPMAWKVISCCCKARNSTHSRPSVRNPPCKCCITRGASVHERTRTGPGDNRRRHHGTHGRLRRRAFEQQHHHYREVAYRRSWHRLVRLHQVH